MQNKIAQTLEPLLGADHFRAGVSADVDLDQRAIRAKRSTTRRNR